MELKFWMDTMWSLVWLLVMVGLVALAIYLVANSVQKCSDATKRAVKTYFGNPTNTLAGPGWFVAPLKGIVGGFIEVPYEIQVEVPELTVESKHDSIDLKCKPTVTLRISKRTPANFITSGGEDAVKREIVSMVTATLQEFAATNDRYMDYKALKKAQKYMIGTLVNAFMRDDVVDLNSDECVKRTHDAMASKNGNVEIPALGITVVQMDIGRLAEPASLDEAAKKAAEQRIINAQKMVETEGDVERLKLWQTADDTVRMKDLQIQEGKRPATFEERKVTVEGAGDLDKLVGVIEIAANAFGRRQQQGGKGKKNNNSNS